MFEDLIQSMIGIAARGVRKRVINVGCRIADSEDIKGRNETTYTTMIGPSLAAVLFATNIRMI